MIIFNKIHYIIFVLLSYSTFVNCLIEIPLIPIKAKVLKYKNITTKESFSVYPKSFRLLETMYDEATITLNNNYYFLSNIKFGSNEQKFNLLLETGGEILWVAQAGSRDSKKIKNHYNPYFSFTGKNTFESFKISFNSENINGFYYTDNIKYINNKSFNMKFGVASRTTFEADNADGVIGLGHHYKDENLSFMHMLKKSGVTDSKIFSLKFEDEIEEGMKGKLFIGKHEDFSSENSVTCPLVEESNFYWICKIDGFSLKKGKNEIESNKRSFSMVFDTATNIILLPLHYLNDIKKNLAKMNCISETEDSVYYQLKCSGTMNNLPDFRFKINGNILTVPSHYMFYSNENYYYSIIFFANSDLYVFGTPFFITFHTLFDSDNEQLHFYPRDPKYVEKENEKEKESEKEKEKEKEREEKKEAEKEIEKEKETETESEEEKEKESEKEKEKENEKEKEKEKEKENEKEKEKESEKEEKEKESEKETEQKEETEKKNENKNGEKTNDNNILLVIPVIIAGIIFFIGLGILIYYCKKSKKTKKEVKKEKNVEKAEPIL